ncbi:hypothetical protein AAAC51_29610 [Priestia megaterium]
MPDFFNEFERFFEQHMLGEHRKRMKEVEKEEKQMEQQERKLQQNVKRLDEQDAEDPFGQ